MMDAAAALQILIQDLPCAGHAISSEASSREDQFKAGRSCAIQALHSLGVTSASLGQTATGAPAWPVQMIGSITHTLGWIGAVAARRSQSFKSIGLDAERRNRKIRPDLASRVCHPQELRNCPLSTDEASLLLFSVRESFYKAAHPLCGLPIGFQQVLIHLPKEFSNAWNPLEVEVIDSWDPLFPNGMKVPGRFLLTPSHLLTLVWIS